MPAWLVVALVGANLGLIYLFLAAPLGLRTIRRQVRIAQPADRIWQALWPLGADAAWSGEIIGSEPAGDSLAWLTLSWEGRDGRPIRRLVRLSDVTEPRRYRMAVEDDTSLEPAFWADFSETVEIVEEGPSACHVTIEQTDRYRGLAFLVFRYFALRRRLSKLRVWAETGTYRGGGMFEHPLTQLGMACLSILLLWPLAGLTRGGLAFAVMLTVVVALHELGHMAAFRLAGHRSARMIFVPLLGGIAVGGRPYDSHFEVAFVALMGAGFSAFLVPPLMALSMSIGAAGNVHGENFFAAIVACLALFNMANLVPVWKFDGGQVLRQILRGGAALAAGSCLLLGFFLLAAWMAGFPLHVVYVAGAVLAVLSIITASSGVKPRHALTPASRPQRALLAAGLVSVMVVHAAGMNWAFQTLA